MSYFGMITQTVTPLLRVTSASNSPSIKRWLPVNFPCGILGVGVGRTSGSALQQNTRNINSVDNAFMGQIVTI